MNPEDPIIPVDKVPFALLEAGFTRACEAAQAGVTEFDIGISGFHIDCVTGKGKPAWYGHSKEVSHGSTI